MKGQGASTSDILNTYYSVLACATEEKKIGDLWKANLVRHLVRHEHPSQHDFTDNLTGTQ